MKFIKALNEPRLAIENYIDRKVVRCLILNEEETEVLFFGNFLVGGGVEEGETDEDAVYRESLEEAGAKVEIIKPLGEVIAYRDFIKKKYIVHGYLCKIIGNLIERTTIDPAEKEQKVTWLKINEAILKLEKEIEDLLKVDSLIYTEEYQIKLHNREASLLFLKEVFENKKYPMITHVQ